MVATEDIERERERERKGRNVEGKKDAGVCVYFPLDPFWLIPAASAWTRSNIDPDTFKNTI